MRRRFWLSRRSADAAGDDADDTLSHLRRRLICRGVYLASRGFASTDSQGHRQHIGFVGGVEANDDGARHWVVEVETTEEYEARAIEQVPSGGTNPLRGRQDADAVEAARQQRRQGIDYTSVGFDAAQINQDAAQAMRQHFNANGFLTSSQFREAYGVAADATIQPGQLVYATSDNSVTATPSSRLPAIGRFVSYSADGNCVVSVDGGGSMTMQLDESATAQDVAAATRQVGVDSTTAQVAAGSAAPSWPRGLLRNLAAAYTSVTRTAENFIGNVVASGRSRDEATTAWRSILDEAQTTTQSLGEVAASRQRQIGVAGTATYTVNGHSAELLVIDDLIDEAEQADVPPRTRRVDAVEVSTDPIAAKWLPRLMPWLGRDVDEADQQLAGLGCEIAAASGWSYEGPSLVYVEERRALKVAMPSEFAGTLSWSHIASAAMGR